MKEKMNRIGKSFSEFKARFTPGFKRVWSGYGYYISLAVLLALFGTAAYMYKNGGGIQNRVAVSASPAPAADTAMAAMAQATPEPSPTPEPAPSFSVPVIGSVSRDFAPDELTWNETLGQWRTHNGVDISAPAGVAVMASEDGVVLDAYEDDMYGYVIVLGHDDGYVTRYCSLATIELVAIGDTVKKGEVISSVGATALVEQSDGAHIHFEITQNGEYIDPAFE